MASNVGFTTPSFALNLVPTISTTAPHINHRRVIEHLLLFGRLEGLEEEQWRIMAFMLSMNAKLVRILTERNQL